jgi:hypothetical protein
MQVGDEQEVLVLILVVCPQADGTDVVANVKAARGGDAAEDSFPGRRSH